MAGFPTAAGVPNMSGTYIPRLYASQLLVAFYAASVFGAIATTEHEAQLQKFGDTLRIRTLPDIAVRTYTKGQNLQYEAPDPSYVDLVIDKGKYWAISVNALDKKQVDLAYVSKWAEHAAATMKVAIDTDVLANTYANAHASNVGLTAGAISGAISLGVTGTPFELTSANILGKIVDCGQVLDEQNIPDEGRWLVLPAWACAMLKKSDLKDASLTGDGTSVLRNGRIGMIDRFDIYRSNNLTITFDTPEYVANAMFGWKGAIAFASQMTDKEEIPNPNDFGTLVRALQAYGYKVVKSEGLGHLYIYA